jgi:hypothetical protein
VCCVYDLPSFCSKKDVIWAVIDGKEGASEPREGSVTGLGASEQTFESSTIPVLDVSLQFAMPY